MSQTPKNDRLREMREAKYARSVKAVVSATLARTPSVNNNAARQAKWRLANAELNRLRARDGMRKRRAVSA